MRPQRKQRRLYDILVRCDLHAEPHKLAVAGLGLSRRQFYRERREALLALAAAIERELQRLRPISVSLELGDAAEAYIEALRSAGQYRTVWREARALAIRAAGEPREIELWIIASEAARYVCGPREVEDALDRARRAVHRLEGRARTFKHVLWNAIGEINRQWPMPTTTECARRSKRLCVAARMRARCRAPKRFSSGSCSGTWRRWNATAAGGNEPKTCTHERRSWPSAVKRLRRDPRTCASPLKSLERKAIERGPSPNTERRSIATAPPGNSVWSQCPPSIMPRSRTTRMPNA